MEFYIEIGNEELGIESVTQKIGNKWKADCLIYPDLSPRPVVDGKYHTVMISNDNIINIPGFFETEDKAIFMALYHGLEKLLVVGKEKMTSELNCRKRLSGTKYKFIAMPKKENDFWIPYGEIRLSISKKEYFLPEIAPSTYKKKAIIAFFAASLMKIKKINSFSVKKNELEDYGCLYILYKI